MDLIQLPFQTVPPKDNNVNVHYYNECINFLFIKCDKYMKIVTSVQINTNLQVTVYTNKQIIHNFDVILTIIPLIIRNN